MIYKCDTTFNYVCEEPKVKVRWSQYWPANIYAPNRIAGCVPLAIAQAMTHFKSLSQINLSFSGKDASYADLSWDEFLKCPYGINNYFKSESQIEDHLQHCDLSRENHQNIGRLIRQIGHDMDCDYKMPLDGAIRGTSTRNDGRIYKEVLKCFPNQKVAKFSKLSDAISGYDAIYLVIAGDEKCVKANEYHTFLVDARASINHYVTIKYDYNPKTGEYSSAENETIKKADYVHINWGWGGQYDGYYLNGLFEPGQKVDWVYPDTEDPRVNDGSKVYGHQLETIRIKP